MKNTKLVAAILLGAAVGTAAILLTKRKSKAMNKLSKKGTDLRDHFRSKMDKFANDSREKVASLKADAKHALS